MSLQQIITQLNGLSNEELDQLSIRIKSLRSLSGNSGNCTNSHVTMMDSDLDFVVSCAAHVAHQLGADSTTYWQLRKAALASPGFREKLPGLLQWLRKIGKDRSQQHAMLCLAYKLLYKDMIKGGYVITARTFLAHTHRLQAVVNRSHPDYGPELLGWLVRRHR